MHEEKKMATTCPVNKIDSDSTSLAISEEKCLKVAADSPVWNGLEPNSYSDFGAAFTSTARSPISRTRQNKKGNISGLSVPAGWNSDLTANSHASLMQGFLFADIEQQKTNKPIGGASLATVASSDNTGSIVFSATVAALYKVGDLVAWQNAPAGASSGLMTVSAVSTDGKTLTVNSPGTFTGAASTELARCGFSVKTAAFSAGSGAPLVLTVSDSGADLTTQSLSVGMWIAIANSAASVVGFGRISVIAKTTITFDDWNFDKSKFASGALNIFTPDVIRNAIDADNIVQRSYQIERRLGSAGAYDQAEYIIGAVPNTAAINIPDSGKVSTDLVFVGSAVDYKTGLDASSRPLSDTQTFIAAAGDESAFNTSTDIVMSRLTTKGDYSSSDPGEAKLFGFISEATININNNVTGNTAIGILGNFDVTAGKFAVSGSITAYFQTVAALVAARENKTCRFAIIGANSNGGFCFDIPALTAPAAQLTVASGDPIRLPISPAAFESDAGYTASYQRFRYLPAIPDAVS